MSTRHYYPEPLPPAPTQSPNSINAFSANTPPRARSKVVYIDESEDILSLNDVSIASSNRSEVKKIRHERRIQPNSTLLPKNLFGRSSYRGSSPQKKQQSISEILDSPSFAPPPSMPIYESRAMFEFHAEGAGQFGALPSYEKIRHSGYIMTRFSQASLLTRKW